MQKVGDVRVERSAANVLNGGYTWTITFLRDSNQSGGQFGGCEQLDDISHQSNSPGDVPKMTSLDELLLGDCTPDWSCTRVTIMDGDSNPDDRPPARKSPRLNSSHYCASRMPSSA